MSFDFLGYRLDIQRVYNLYILSFFIRICSNLDSKVSFGPIMTDHKISTFPRLNDQTIFVDHLFGVVWLRVIRVISRVAAV